MTSAEIRQSYLDFFRSKNHTIVPSSSLMPDAPNLLFTNAGMNQFVPIFLGQRPADVSRWGGAIPGSDLRAADTQKCIRAGGKHNDLDDVGLDTYHHTFFEMLGNWSFGDYFKSEAIQWAWELIVGKWGFPPERLYATVYSPGEGDPSEFDQEAHGHWEKLFRSVGLDPAIHIVNGNKADNFWMMGDTGPCGPCSELHVDLTPNGDTGGSLVNAGDSRCIEIWNLVFIQYNANADGSFSPLPARHVDTGMGFERVTSIIQGTKNFTDFANAHISNYETDIFRPIFDALEEVSGKRYGSTLPEAGSTGETEQEIIDVAFRVIADHIRTLSFSIADGIQPGNTDRNYVLRRILRRAVRYGRALDLHEPFFYKLADVVARTMGGVFPELREHLTHIKHVLESEEEAFNKTLDRGIKMFEGDVFINALAAEANAEGLTLIESSQAFFVSDESRTPEKVAVDELTFLRDQAPVARMLREELFEGGWQKVLSSAPKITGDDAFKLYDTYGFPLDLTELMARERGLGVDLDGFNERMAEQRERGRAAQKREIIEAGETSEAVTEFVGFDTLVCDARVIEIVRRDDSAFAVLDRSPFFAEMGGQVGDTGSLHCGGREFAVQSTTKRGHTFLLRVPSEIPDAPQDVRATVDRERRSAVERHHTVTHLLHWALHEVVDRKASQKGSYVGPEKLTFDFNSTALTPQQIVDVERLVNERILEASPVFWTEVPYTEVRDVPEIMQFFGDKYGDVVRVVQIGGCNEGLDGFSMELCGGTHVRSTGQLGSFRILAESAIAAGVRRIEAAAGWIAFDDARGNADRLVHIASQIGAPVVEVEKKIDSLLAHQKTLEKQLAAAEQKLAAASAGDLLEKVRAAGLRLPSIIENLPGRSGNDLQSIAEALRPKFDGAIVLASALDGTVALVASMPTTHAKALPAGKIIQTIAPVVGGKGGGRPEFARGGGKETSKVDQALAAAEALLAEG